MDVDLLIAKTERTARRAAIWRSEDLQLHAKDVTVERDGLVDIGRCQNDMVDGSDHDALQR